MNHPAKNIENKSKGKTIRYYGGKSKLTGFIVDSLSKTGIKPGASILDGFTGTSVVAQTFKEEGFRTTANDHMYFSYALADAHLHFNKSPKFQNLDGISYVFKKLNSLNSKPDFITLNYSPYEKNERKYFTVENAIKIDSIRNQIEKWDNTNLINHHEKNYLLACLIHSVNLVSNITGTYGAYLKFWESRSTKKLTLNPLPESHSKHRNKAWNMDINKAVKKQFDYIYLDPPYNSRNYFSNYFLLEIVARGWHKSKYNPVGITGKPNNIELPSDFNSKKNVEGAFHKMIANCNSENIAISYNNEGLIPIKRIMEICSIYGKIRIFDIEHKRYRSINQTGKIKDTKEILITIRKK